MQSQFEIATPGLFTASYLAEVVAVNDPNRLGRVQVRLISFDAGGDQDGLIWARVAVPFAGGDRGAFMLPDVGDEVLVSFVNGDSRLPVVVGGLWNGTDHPPESLGGAGDRVDRWTIVGKAGTRIAIIEESSSTATIKLTTPNGVSGELTDEGGGKIELKTAMGTITIDAGGITVRSTSSINIQASADINITAPATLNVTSPIAQFSGIVQCNTLMATTVVSGTYTTGAGNVL